MKKRKIFMACGMNMPKDEKLIEELKLIAKHVAETGWTIAQGGNYTGIMGLMVDEFAKYSNDIYMIMPKKFRKDLPKLTFKELMLVEDEASRLVNIVKKCEVIVILPGGSGTIEEFMYLIETKKYFEHEREIIVFNYEGYYNDLFTQFKICVDFGLLAEGALKFKVAETSKELCKLIDLAK